METTNYDEAAISEIEALFGNVRQGAFIEKQRAETKFEDLVGPGNIEPVGFLADGAISALSLFVSTIRPVGIVTSLPALPSTDYPIGSTVVLTTDGRLYRNVADAWTAAVGAISGGIESLGALPALPNASYPIGSVVYYTVDGKLYRNVANAWSKAVDGGDITASTVTANAILAGTITGAKIAAGTITGGLIAANTITAANIAADTITAAEIAAGAIATSELAVGFSMASGNVIIAAGGITINNGVLTLNDQFGSNVISGAGFGASWLRFIDTGVYNNDFGVGTTANITAATIVGTAGTNANYLASLSTDIPYWVVGAESGAGTFKRVADANAPSGFAMEWNGNEDATIFQDIPIQPGQAYDRDLLWKYTGAGGNDFNVEWQHQFLDATHGAIGSEIDDGGVFNTTQSAYTTQSIGTTGVAPANARYLRIGLRNYRAAGSPNIRIASIRIEPIWVFSTQINYANTRLSNYITPGDTYVNFELGPEGSILWGAGGGTPPDVNVYRSSAGALTISGVGGAVLKLVSVGTAYSAISIGGRVLLDYGSGGAVIGRLGVFDNAAAFKEIVRMTFPGGNPAIGFFGGAGQTQSALAAATGTIKRTTYATGTVTLAQLAGVVMAIIADLRGYGLEQ